VRADSALRRWGLALKKRLGFKRAATALARKMAVVLHAMWKFRHGVRCPARRCRSMMRAS